MRLDLHLHTAASDGAWDPIRVIRAAASGGLDLVAVTDHDTVAGLPEAARAAEEEGLTLIPGCELSSTHQGRDVHMLAYGIDADAACVREHEVRARERRAGRMVEMVERLAAAGVEVSIEDVLQRVETGGVLGRPHLAGALVEAGYADNVPAAFDQLIGDRHPAFVPTLLLDPAGAVRLAHAAGGVAVWAHPPADLLDPLLPELIAAGLDGLEVYRPRSGPAQIQRLLRRAATSGLCVTGGSDWHNPDRNGPLGSFSVSEAQVEHFLRLLKGD